MMKWSKVIGVWCCFIPLAILNGGLREYVWHRFLPESAALALSGVLLAGLIYVVTFLLLPRIKDLTKKIVSLWEDYGCVLRSVLNLVWDCHPVLLGKNCVKHIIL